MKKKQIRSVRRPRHSLNYENLKGLFEKQTIAFAEIFDIQARRIAASLAIELSKYAIHAPPAKHREAEETWCN
jgi:hypothetical protein